jgi:non-heme chloroperoxidase
MSPRESAAANAAADPLRSSVPADESSVKTHPCLASCTRSPLHHAQQRKRDARLERRANALQSISRHVTGVVAPHPAYHVVQAGLGDRGSKPDAPPWWEEGLTMAYLHVGEENSTSIELYYEDHGVGAPVILVHGFPLSGRIWEKQTPTLLNAGFQVILYDRRGFGRSSQPTVGYTSDTFAADLHILMTTLDLGNAVLIGHGLGAGDIVRYLATYGTERVARVASIAPTPPFLLKTADNAAGVDGSAFDAALQAIRADRPAFLATYLADVYNLNPNVDANLGEFDGDLARPVHLSNRISYGAFQFCWHVAMNASPKATEDCLLAELTDYREDLPKIDIPTLIIQGDQDRILPIQATGQRLASLIDGARLEVIADGPHGIIWTHAEEVNSTLLDFLER